VARTIKDSVHIWPSIGKAHVRKKKDEEATVWNNVPEEVRQAGIIATDNDYHGNFNTEVFDALFRRLCQKLNDMGLGPCHIHLDGAKYHFHNTSKKPNSSNKVDEIKEWLRANGYGIPVSAKGEGYSPTKEELVAYLKNIDHPPRYSIRVIAEENGGHIIFKTPPYHCELQSIEMIWGIIKNMVAANYQGKTTPAELKKMLDYFFLRITRETFISVWMKTIETGIRYATSSEGPQGAAFVGQDAQNNPAADHGDHGDLLPLPEDWEELDAFEVLNEPPYTFEAVDNNLGWAFQDELADLFTA